MHRRCGLGLPALKTRYRDNQTRLPVWLPLEPSYTQKVKYSTTQNAICIFTGLSESVCTLFDEDGKNVIESAGQHKQTGNESCYYAKKH